MHDSSLHLVAALWLLLPVGAASQESEDAGAPPAQSLSGTIARVDSTLAEADDDGMNGVVHIRVGGEVLLHRAYGWRDRERADSMIMEVGFDIGSLVKPMTAVAVLKAGEEGLLGTAEQVARWYRALIEGRILGAEALERYFEFAADPSPTGEGRLMGHAGGNGVFNSLQVSWIEADVHFTLFTSTAPPLNAESSVEVDDIFAIRRAAGNGSGQQEDPRQTPARASSPAASGVRQP